ncbi:hypothetical protein BGX27_003395 [Mortierella sp. AM989]|nr:hypothetical protein BGX27_003395 [Mortierella sp. AM989]
MLFRTTIIASAALALAASVAEAHSWVDCTDWRFNNPAKPGFSDKDGKCHGWARQFPVGGNVPDFGLLDSFSPSRHFQQKDTSNPAPCSTGDRKSGADESGADETRKSPISKAYGGKWGTQASANAGSKICLRWPAKNHAVKTEKENFVFVNMPQTLLDKDPDQDGFTKSNIAKIPYKNCNYSGNDDTTPCGGCFNIPSGLASGNYVLQWRWTLNKGETYTSCWDLNVTGGANGTAILGPDTSIFNELYQD